MKSPFHNETSQVKDTLFGRAIAEQGTIQGRFAAESRARVVGSRPLVEYPALPPNSPSWASHAVGQEPPVGFDINAVEPVGTHAEIEQSLAEVGDGAATPSDPLIASPNDEGRAPLGGKLPADASRRPRRLSKRKKA